MIEINGFSPIDFNEVPKILQDECLTCTKTMHRPEGERCCYKYYRACERRPESAALPARVELKNRRDGRLLTLELSHP